MSKNAEKKAFKPIWIIISFIVLITILLLPTPNDLPIMAKCALAILAFAVIMWVTEAVTYPVSAVMIVGLIVLLTGFSPVQDLADSLGNPAVDGKAVEGDALLGTSNALKMALSGFSGSQLRLLLQRFFSQQPCK